MQYECVDDALGNVTKHCADVIAVEGQLQAADDSGGVDCVRLEGHGGRGGGGWRGGEAAYAAVRHEEQQGIFRYDIPLFCGGRGGVGGGMCE